jgi:hypothetical protein
VIYLIKYYPEPPDNTEWELEWGRFPGQWSVASREAGSTAWYFSKELGSAGYEALLKHFGLWERRADFPENKVIKMSPADLNNAEV